MKVNPDQIQTEIRQFDFTVIYIYLGKKKKKSLYTFRLCFDDVIMI